MPDRVKLSVVIPAYNSAKYIGAAVASALAQNVSDMEVLVMNNASTDGTAEVVASFADPRVRLVTHETNVGMVLNFRSGLEAARGEYLSFLCADDVYVPNALNKLVELLDGSPAAVLAFGDVDYIDEAGRVTGQHSAPVPSEMAGREYVLLSLRAAFNYMYLSSVVLRREALMKCGGIEAADGTFFDWNMWLRLALCGPVLHYDNVVLNYRFHPENESKKIKLPSLYVTELVDGALARGLTEPDLAPALAGARRSCYHKYSHDVLFSRFDGLPVSAVAGEIMFFADKMPFIDVLASAPYFAAAFLPVWILKFARCVKLAMTGRAG